METKEDLKNKVSKLEDKISELEKMNSILEEELKDIDINSCINNLENFIWRLKLDNVYTDKLGDFIDNYLKFYN